MLGQTAIAVTPQDMVRSFHHSFGLTVTPAPTLDLPEHLLLLRLRLVEEEVGELAVALQARDVVAAADALADIVYVAYGAAVTFGLDLDEVIAEVHRANMTKLGRDGHPLVRADGKVIKGPDYQPPRIAAVLARQY